MRIKIKYQIRKIYYEKKEKNNSKKNITYINYKQLLRSYAELQIKLKALEDIVSINDSKNNWFL